MRSDLLFDYLANLETSIELLDCGKDCGKGITKQSYEISTASESKKYNKPEGKYELIGTDNLLYMGDRYLESVEGVLFDSLNNLIGKIFAEDRILVVGLGNRHIASDSLGAKVVSRINITLEDESLPKVMAINPSVMGLTGIETFDIVDGVARNVGASHLILIDSLCAGMVDRLGRSIQVTNTGICPGSGIGNKRKCIDNSVAPKVFSIGVPLLIYASTFVSDALMRNNIDSSAINSIMRNIKKSDKSRDLLSVFESLKNVLEEDMDNMIVAFKDIDEYVEIVAKIIANVINKIISTAH